jgi:hypothetical protein
MPDLAHTRPAALPHLAHADAGTPQPAMQWDVFCRVIDNHGDLGVCWRLACHLAALGSAVRLWVDQATDLQWMAPHGHPGVQVLPLAHRQRLARSAPPLDHPLGTAAKRAHCAYRVGVRRVKPAHAAWGD